MCVCVRVRACLFVCVCVLPTIQPYIASCLNKHNTHIDDTSP